MSVQATVLKLFRSLRQAFDLTTCSYRTTFRWSGSMRARVAVMYLGRIVVIAPTEVLFDNPRHPYEIAAVGVA